jgi:hypothetical protein
MSVAGTVLLFSVDRDFRAVHVVYHSLGLGSIHGLCLAIIFPIDSPQTFQIPAWLSTSVSNQCGREGNAAPRPQIFSEPIHWNPARARQEYFRPGMENGRISLQSGRTLALFICRRVSSIEQRQHCDSRIFYFLVSRAQPLALVVALAWVHQSSKTGIGVPDLVSSVRFWLTLPNDFQGMGSYDRFATET